MLSKKGLEKVHVNVATFGHVDHSKETLANFITKTLEMKYGSSCDLSYLDKTNDESEFTLKKVKK